MYDGRKAVFSIRRLSVSALVFANLDISALVHASLDMSALVHAIIDEMCSYIPHSKLASIM